MGFETPLFLLGALGIAVPLAIHLLNRRQAKPTRFAAIEFILRSKKSLIRRVKLRQLLILLARIALILFLALALAKPFTHTEGFSTFGGDPPTATVFVLDTSWSMQASENKVSNLERARKRLRSILQLIRQDEMVALVLASHPSTAPVARLTYDKQRLLEGLAKVGITTRGTDLQGAIRIAERILNKGPTHLDRRIVIISDHSRHAWAKVSKPWGLPQRPTVQLIRIGSKQTRENLALTDVTVKPAPDISPNHYTISVSLANYSSKAFFKPIKLSVQQKTLKGYPDKPIPPGERSTKQFLIKVSGNQTVIGTVELPDDALLWDNRIDFMVRRVKLTNVLLVNGAPRTVPYLDESYFVSLALRPRSDVRSRIVFRVVKSDELAGARLQDADAIFLLNAPGLPATVVNRLRRYVESGGGLLISSGGNVTTDYNKTMKPLLPYTIRGVKVIANPNDQDSHLRSLLFSKMQRDHAIFRPFRSNSKLFLGQTFQYLLLDSKLGASRVLWSYDNGAPVLVERKLKAGRVLFFTTTLDRDWSNFAIQSSFLPFLHQLTYYLAGSNQKKQPLEVRVHQTVTIPLSPGLRKIRITTPDRRIYHFNPYDQKNRKLFHFKRTETPGIYHVEKMISGARLPRTEQFVARLGADDSDLRQVSTPKIRRILQLSGKNSPKPIADTQPRSRQKLNLWPFAIFALVLLLFAETMLVAKR